jgi:hypothetical protein
LDLENSKKAIAIALAFVILVSLVPVKWDAFQLGGQRPTSMDGQAVPME